MSPRRAVPLLAAALLLPTALPAAVYTVGPGGTHASVQAAIDAARLTTTVDDEVRIAQGVWNERVAFSSPASDRLDVSGGWNAAFDAQIADPALTVIDAGHGGTAFRMLKGNGIATLRNLSFARGRSPETGANLAVRTSAFARVEISDCILRDGEALADGRDFGVGYGSGIQVSAFDGSSVLLQRCEVRDNLVQTGSVRQEGAAVHLRLAQDASARVSEFDVHHNQAGGAKGVGSLVAVLAQRARLEVFDSRFADNVVVNDPGVASLASGVLLRLGSAVDLPDVEFRRNRVLRNTVQDGPPAVQLQANGAGASNLVLGDSVIAGSARDGGLAFARADAATAALINLTLADNAGNDLAAGYGVAIANTLADRVDAIVAAATVTNSRFGQDPGYVDRAAGDYRLRPDSPAIDAGTSTPTGGLGPRDIDGHRRVRGQEVDQGAHEIDRETVFGDGFEVID